MSFIHIEDKLSLIQTRTIYEVVSSQLYVNICSIHGFSSYNTIITETLEITVERSSFSSVRNCHRSFLYLAYNNTFTLGSI